MLTKIAPIRNNNESHWANTFQRWFIGLFIFQILPVKICSLGYTLADNFFGEKYLYIIFKSNGLEISQITID